jgi:SAM-dependent methyltransferase
MPSATTTKTPKPNIHNPQYDWDDRYKAEGHIWGDEPSLTARILAKKLEPASNVLEFGCGYGRDINELAQQGHRITGVEKSKIAVSLAEDDTRLDKFIDSGRVHILRGEFASASFGKAGFDAVLSHRVLHLLGTNGLVRAFEQHAYRVLKQDGLLAVSARNEDDFDKDQMKLLAPGIAEYKSRPGHIIRFWTHKMFEDTFTDNFKIIEFIHGTEIESQKNPKDTHFTIMLAQRKP